MILSVSHAGPPREGVSSFSSGAIAVFELVGAAAAASLSLLNSIKNVPFGGGDSTK